MGNCIIAQSGGPTAVINSSLFGIYDECIKSRFYKKIYAGLNGIEGIINNKIIDLSDFDYSCLNGLMYTPSTALGSCRYKLNHFYENESDYIKILKIFRKLNIETFFYIGGNDSMDTVKKLSEYFNKNNIDIKAFGIPKTIDNDLYGMDHTPGFGSAAKLISTISLETYLDFNSYNNTGVFILETMGRDTGWLASSGALVKINNKCIIDYIYLPEKPFYINNFLNDIEIKIKTKKRVFIIASEGLKNEKGDFLSIIKNSNEHDKFNHNQLGGVSQYLKSLIIENKIANRVKTLELGIIQRSSMHCASQTDINEAYEVGKYAVQNSKNSDSGYMTAIKRISNKPYTTEISLVHTSDVANKIKYFPNQWINDEGNHVTEETTEYLLPLIEGDPCLKKESSSPKYVLLDL